MAGARAGAPCALAVARSRSHAVIPEAASSASGSPGTRSSLLEDTKGPAGTPYAGSRRCGRSAPLAGMTKGVRRHPRAPASFANRRHAPTTVLWGVARERRRRSFAAPARRLAWIPAFAGMTGRWLAFSLICQREAGLEAGHRLDWPAEGVQAAKRQSTERVFVTIRPLRPREGPS